MKRIARVFQLGLFLAIASSVFFGMHLLVFKSLIRAFALNVEAWKWLLILLPFSYIIAAIWIRYFPNIVSKLFYVLSSVWLGSIFVLFSIFVFYELYHVISRTDSRFFASTALTISVALIVSALLNARIIRVKEVSLSFARAPRDMTIIQLSDIHVGTINNERYLERLVEMTNAERPDLVLITGDLFDGSAPIDAKSLTPLEKLRADTYFSIGNHEVYEGLEKVRTAISDTSLVLLENERELVSGIQLVGINDPADPNRPRKLVDVLKNISLEKDMFTIFMSHSPVEWNVAREAGADLMLSGHTHNGQIVPFNFIVKLFYPKIKGLYEEGEKYLYTSPGTGTWGPPMRLGSTAEITVFKIEKNQL